MGSILSTLRAMPQRTIEEQNRAASLRSAEDRALSFSNQISRDLIRSGIAESALSKEIHALGFKEHGVRTHWHKRVVRSGPNTLQPYRENPPDRVIQSDDILFVDLGAVFAEYESDFGRTYVLGTDSAKIKIRDALEPLWQQTKSDFRRNSEITGAELFDIACRNVEAAGYKYGGPIAGHLVGEFPHERIVGDQITLYIHPDNHEKMRQLDKHGHERHWILEIHLVDEELGLGGFFEQLLTID